MRSEVTEDSEPAPSLVLVVCNAAGSVVLNMRGNENVSLGGERCEVRGESKEKTESWIVFAQRKVYVYFLGGEVSITSLFVWPPRVCRQTSSGHRPRTCRTDV